MRVLPDQPAIDKQFDYVVPASMATEVEIGTMVRVDLHGRRVGGWVVDDDVDDLARPTTELKPIAKVSGVGPPADLIDLAGWASWRWAGRPAQFLRTASPERMVRGPLRGPTSDAVGLAAGTEPRADVMTMARGVLRLPPAANQYSVVHAAAQRGNALVLVPTLASAARLVERLRSDHVRVGLYPQDWVGGRAGATMVGARAAAWAPVHDLAAVVVIDEHDESYQQEQSPTWHARDVVIERARRAGVPCLLISPMPTLEALQWGELATVPRAAEREGWPLVEVVDRRDEPPGSGMFSERFVRLLRDDIRIVCVLNRKGRSRLLACATCGEVARCERCDSSVAQDDDGQLVCRRCGTRRPVVCLACGATKFKNLRAGVARVREELEALARRPVVEVTAESTDVSAEARIFVGTEAVLHHVRRADVVAFLDFDQELLAPRYRAAEEALALLVRAARILGPRERGGRLLVQTRQPRHEVLDAAVHADPQRVSDEEQRRRELLRFPPVSAMVVVSGASAAAFMTAFGAPPDVEVLPVADDRWLLRAERHAPLLDALRATPRPGGRLRVEVDPLRI